MESAAVPLPGGSGGIWVGRAGSARRVGRDLGRRAGSAGQAVRDLPGSVEFWSARGPRCSAATRLGTHIRQASVTSSAISSTSIGGQVDLDPLEAHLRRDREEELLRLGRDHRGPLLPGKAAAHGQLVPAERDEDNPPDPELDPAADLGLVGARQRQGDPPDLLDGDQRHPGGGRLGRRPGLPVRPRRRRGRGPGHRGETTARYRQFELAGCGIQVGG